MWQTARKFIINTKGIISTLPFILLSSQIYAQMSEKAIETTNREILKSIVRSGQQEEIHIEMD